jgi:hypothetical protein
MKLTGVAELPERRETTDPGANVEWTYTVPAGETLELVAVSVQCVQGITQTPWPCLQITDGTNVVFAAYSGSAAQAASTTAQHTWSVGTPLAIAGATTAVKATGPLPAGLILGPGYVVSSVTAGKGANTDYGKASLWVRRH